MTRVYQDQEFCDLEDRDSAAVFSDLELNRCTFRNCRISVTTDPRLRSIAQNVVLRNCVCLGIPEAVWCPILEEVLVENLRIEHGLHTWGAVFRRVTLRGRIGVVMIRTFVSLTLEPPETLRPLNEANAAYYDTVDWALDISRAEFAECDIRGIPARLIRRDPETQVVVTREKALEGEWKHLDLQRTYWKTSIECMLDEGYDDAVLVAPKRSRRFKELLAGLQLLREAGVAEPD